MRPHPRRARTDPTHPQAWGTSDRNGMINNQRNLRWQYEWAGTALINKRILVSPDEYDTPNRQLGTIILPPDPVSILNARPEPYSIDEQVYLMAQDGQQLYAQDGTPLLAMNDQQTFALLDGSLFLSPDGGAGRLTS
jgi:hypothetical protein